MKRALLVASLLCAGACAQQDAALLVTLTGQDFLIPSGGDRLTLDVYDGTRSIKHLQWCATPSAGCPALAPQNPLSASVTLVQSGSAHPHLKLNGALFLAGHLTGAGSTGADFSPGRTTSVILTLTPP